MERAFINIEKQTSIDFIVELIKLLAWDVKYKESGEWNIDVKKEMIINFKYGNN